MMIKSLVLTLFVLSCFLFGACGPVPSVAGAKDKGITLRTHVKPGDLILVRLVGGKHYIGTVLEMSDGWIKIEGENYWRVSFGRATPGKVDVWSTEGVIFVLALDNVDSVIYGWRVTPRGERMKSWFKKLIGR